MKRLIPSLPETPDLGDVFRAFPTNVVQILQLDDAIMCDPAAINQGDRELIAAYVSALNACQFCAGAHLNAAEAFGIERTVLDELLNDVETARVDTALKPILRYVGKLTQTPSRLTEADAQAVYAAGWSEEALYDAIKVCALFNFMNRIVEGTGVSADVSGSRPVTEADKKERRARRYTDWARAEGLMS
ncbi:carboxymuconolactone decarboxylase family protein [Sulfitobacter aestuariivivens]|uniref:Peroxidase-related enzyme n=1 Tax=Sulfitobacter aestuariivivens TaxID=2766981 RepID=A0A927HD55_9RHOB|nr:peroxidase-related enzyme [Sulfitobacter aestuariivivens]MBD3663307.1 peroxidase-related enzyme [Sulfitobacter aestuariivivens]